MQEFLWLLTNVNFLSIKKNIYEDENKMSNINNKEKKMIKKMIIMKIEENSNNRENDDVYKEKKYDES